MYSSIYQRRCNPVVVRCCVCVYLVSSFLTLACHRQMHDYAARFSWERRESTDQQVTFKRRLGPTEAFIHTSHHYLNAASSPIVIADVAVIKEKLDSRTQTDSLVDVLQPRFETAWKILTCRHPLLSTRVELIKNSVDESSSSSWNFILDAPPIRSASAGGSLLFVTTATGNSAQDWIQENVLASNSTRPWEEFTSACCYVIVPTTGDGFTLAIHALHCIATARVLVGLVDELLQLLWAEIPDAASVSWDNVESRLLPAQEDIFADLAGLNKMTDQDILLLEMTWQSDIVTDVMQPTSGLEPIGSFPPDQHSCEAIICRLKLPTDTTSRLVALSKTADVTITHLVYAALAMSMSRHSNVDIVSGSTRPQPFIFYPNSIDLSKLLNEMSRRVLLTMSGYPTILPVDKQSSSETLISLAKIAKSQYEKYINHPRFWAYTCILAWNMFKSVESLISGEREEERLPPSPVSPASSPLNVTKNGSKNGSSKNSSTAAPAFSPQTLSPTFTSPRQYFTPSSWTSVSSIASTSHLDSLQTCRPGPQVPIVNSLGDLSTIVRRSYHCAEVTDLRIVIRPDPGALGTHVWTFNDQLSLQVIANGAYWGHGDIERLVQEAVRILS